jgi:basic membrane lipoprotein Med (substrate-binding protein (PBP1-ABC) superfamily)
MRRSSRLFFSTLALGGAAMACAPADRTADSTATRDSTDFRVALLTPGAISDQSWNGGAYQGLLRLRDSLGARISHIQTKTPAEFEENFRQYGTQGYALVIGHGYEYQDAAKRVAPDFPKTVFLVSSSEAVQPPNVAGIKFAFAEASYLAGVAAGRLTKSGIIAAIGGQELPPVKESFDFFAAGARSVNPSVQVRTAYIGNWDDVSAGKEQALAQISRGADVIFQNADAAGLGVFQAARETKKALVVGSNADQNGVAPEVTIGSVVIDLPHAFHTVARDVKQGSFTARTYEMGVTSKVVTLVMNPAFSALPPAVRAEIDSIAASMTSGTFDRARALTPTRP